MDALGSGSDLTVQDLTGPFQQCYSGRKFYPASPTPDQFYIGDIARALSHICRFAGHVHFFYSVAQHLVMCYRTAPPEHRAWALMHDASEGHLVDVPRPTKICLPDYRRLEQLSLEAMAQRFGLPWPMPEIIHEIDNRMLVTEAGVLLKAPTDGSLPWWKESCWPKPYDLRLEVWSADRARAEFLEAFLECVAAGELCA